VNKRWRFIAIAVFLSSSVLSFGVWALSKVAGVIEVGRTVDMPVVATTGYVRAAGKKLGWREGSLSDQRVQLLAPNPPLGDAQINVKITTEQSGATIRASGHATKVKQLIAEIDQHLPRLQ
jgi:hypothetical protein